MLLVLFSYVGMCALLRVVFRLRRTVSAFGGLIFAFSSLNASRLGHIQLLISFVYPLMFICVYYWLKSFKDQFFKGLLFGSIAAILLSTSLFTSYNACWLLCLFALLWLLVAAVFSIIRGNSRLWDWTRITTADIIASKAGIYLGLPLTVFIVCLVPFFLTYIPMVKMGYGASYDDISKNLPRLVDLINLGPWNQTWGQWLPRVLPSILIQNDPNFYEHALGFPLVFLGVFFSSCVMALSRWLSKQQVGPGSFKRRDTFIIITGLTIVVSWILMIRWGSYSFWRIVLAVVPGAQGVRAVFRFQTVLYFFACIIVALQIDRISRLQLTMRRRCFALLLLLIMMAEQSSRLYAEIDKSYQRATFARIEAPPPTCKEFYVVAKSGPPAKFWYAIDAMYVSAFHRLPTINGYNGQGPVNYVVGEPGSTDYNILIAEWLVRNRLFNGVCALDLDTGKWKEIHPSGDVPRGKNLMTPNMNGEVGDRMWIGLQDFSGIGLSSGEWTSGNSTVVFVKPQMVDNLEFSFGMPRENGGMVRVFVDGWLVLDQRFSKGDHYVNLPLHEAISSIRLESDRFSLESDRFSVFRKLGIYLHYFEIR
jgi:hypothetical protein